MIVEDRRRLLRLFSPDVLCEPLVVVFHHRALLLGLVDGMAEAFIEDQLHRNAAIFQSLIKLERVGWRNALILIAMLDERGRLGVVHVEDRRSFLIDGRIFPWSRFQILAREG